MRRCVSAEPWKAFTGAASSTADVQLLVVLPGVYLLFAWAAATSRPGGWWMRLGPLDSSVR
ncbi:MAG: hypothetical protein AAF662_04480 [Pseudomonadota bacterium]